VSEGWWRGLESGAILKRMTLDDYKTVLYRQEDGSWVAEVPAISGCYALMPTRAEALSELAKVFELIAEEYLAKGQPLPADSTEIVNA
jgi:predicted RNase H-like HicB family nuclease